MTDDGDHRNGFLGLFKKNQESGNEEMIEEEIISMLDEAHESGVLEKDEADMIQNIMSFSDTDAHEVMTHRLQFSAISDDTTLDDALTYMLEDSYSRYPVYADDLDDIVGIIHIKDAVRTVREHPEKRNMPVRDLPEIIRSATLVPETRPINAIFSFMRRNKEHMIIVIDEYGQTAGLVTMEDILEEIVGNILDEHDEDEHFIRHGYDNSIYMDGLIPLEDAREELGPDFAGNEDSEYETLNGYLTALLDHVPTEEDRVIRDGSFMFRILETDNHIIKRVRVERLPNVM